MMAERRVAHTRQSRTDSQIISQDFSGQHSPNLLSTAEVSSVDAQDLEKAGADSAELPKRRFKTTWDRFLGRGRKPVGVIQSIKKIYGCSWLNLLLILTPVAWWAHFDERFADSHTAVFSLCFLSIVPHECLFDYCGEQMAMYCGKDFGDLITITLNNAVEVTLAIMLLLKCELKLLQSTITGVVLLHLLLVPGAAFLTGGADIWEQDLHPVHTQLNHTLLTVGVLALLLPASFYAAISGSTSNAISANGELPNLGSSTQTDFLRMSRGLAILLLLIYICSRIFYHNPPGAGNNSLTHSLTPAPLKAYAEKLEREEPEVNQWVCICFLIINIAIMAVTSEWLVDSIEPVRNISGITSEWFGLVLIPFVSFSADGAVAAGYFCHKALRRVWSKTKDPGDPPSTLAKAEAIDLSIQFILLWMPFLTLLGWWTGKPFSLLFDFFEVALLLGACFLVNFVTADSKTNWAEGFILLSFYAMMVLCTWFYTGESDVSSLVLCPGESAAIT
jgi:Ca2+:H+ antiporter